VITSGTHIVECSQRFDTDTTCTCAYVVITAEQAMITQDSSFQESFALMHTIVASSFARCASHIQHTALTAVHAVRVHC
jgi:hypothetical protein